METVDEVWLEGKLLRKEEAGPRPPSPDGPSSLLFIVVGS